MAYYSPLQNPIKELIQRSIGSRLHRKELREAGLDYHDVLEDSYTRIRAIAEHDTLENAVEYLYKTKPRSTKESLTQALLTTQNECKKELDAYKMSISLEKQGAADAAIIEAVETFLK